MSDISQLVDDSAEGGVLASLIYHPEYLLSDNNLQPRFFFRQENQVIFWAIEKLVESGVTKIDPLNLRNALYSNPACQKIIEKYGLTDLQEYISIAQNAVRGTYEEYKLLANTVVSLAFRRDLCSLSSEIGKECFNLNISLDELNEYANSGINKVAEKFVFGGDSVQFGEKIDSIWEEICEDRNPDGSFGVSNIIHGLDEFFTFGKGELILVAGGTGKGKSAYMLAQAIHALKSGFPCVILDSELTDKVFAPRLIANLSQVPVRTVKKGDYSKDQENKIKKAIEYIKKADFVHEYTPVFSKLKVDQIVRKWYNKDKLGFLVYDYIKPSEVFGAADISQGMGLMTDYLKSVAGNLNIPVLAGLQLNKQTGTVADSQKPEKYADVLMFWREKTPEQYREDGPFCGNYYIQVMKNRNGNIHKEDDYVDVNFNGDYMRVSEASQHAKERTPFEGK